MRKLALSLLLVTSFFPLKAEEEAILVMRELVQASEKNLENQRRLLAFLEEFYQARERFVQESTNAQLGSALVRAAMRVQKELEQEQLAHLFTPEFLEEIRFFNQMGNRAIRAHS